ncbi:hypothetical protein ACSTIH_23630, partial [Vibrio parahaemolyticus]
TFILVSSVVGADRAVAEPDQRHGSRFAILTSSLLYPELKGLHHVLHLTNTLSGQKEPFTVASLPVRMYVCGLTPKNEPHLGHARLFIANDIIR